jgi:hypothetical protein
MGLGGMDGDGLTWLAAGQIMGTKQRPVMLTSTPLAMADPSSRLKAAIKRVGHTTNITHTLFSALDLG